MITVFGDVNGTINDFFFADGGWQIYLKVFPALDFDFADKVDQTLFKICMIVITGLIGV